MKNYFFINPAAGQGKGIEKLIREIETVSHELGLESYIYITKSVLDGEKQARYIAEKLGGEKARFVVCGGDGTNNEVINGSRGFDNISVGAMPIGTGNDWIRNFPDAGDFMSVKAQLLGSAVDVDLIKYSGIIDGRYQERLCANMFNIGFDCNCVAAAAKLKKKPLIAGSLAYLLGIFTEFVKKDTIGIRVISGGETIVDDDVLLCSIANGSYCGGGVHTMPQATVDDGVFDLSIIRNVSRMEFLKLFPSYKAGKHLDIPGIEDVIKVSRHKSLTLIPKDGKFRLCADGEITTAETVEFEIVPKAMKFNVPAVL